jgi:arylsulfatase A-like enzyme
MVMGIRDFLVGAGEWDNTFFVFTSDHGYNLGQFRVDSDKTMVYDHGIAFKYYACAMVCI